MARVIDRVIVREEFSLGVRRLKAEYVATDIESSKQTVQKQLATRIFNPAERSAATQPAQEMHATIKEFVETNFSLYLCLDELDLAGLCQLRLDPPLEERRPVVYPGDIRPSSAPRY